MMYTQFLCAALLLLSNSFYYLQPMTMTMELVLDDIDILQSQKQHAAQQKAFEDYIQQRNAAKNKTKNESLPIAQTTTIVDTIVDTKVDIKTITSNIFITNEDGETAGTYFDRLDQENEIKRAFYTAGLLTLAQHPTISKKYKAQIAALTNKHDWVEQYYRLHELEFRKTSIIQTQGIIDEVLPYINPEYIPTAIYVPAYPYSKKDIASSLSIPLQTIAITDCEAKIIDQLSTTHRSFWSWLVTRRQPVTVFFVPTQNEKQKAEDKPMYVECVEAATAQFDTNGELGIAGAKFQNCYEVKQPKKIGDDRSQKNPNVLYMSAGDGCIQITLTGLGVAGTFVPVIVPVAMAGATGYVVWEIFKTTETGKDFVAAWKERSEKKAARKAEEAKAKAERKAQEEKLKAEKKAQLEQQKNNSGGGPEKPDDDKNKKGLNKKQQAELDKQKRYPAQNEPIGNKGVYEDAGYHHPNSQGAKSPAPKNGQKALNNSVLVKEKGNNNYQRRVGISDSEIVILDETSSGKFHGHVRTWKEICNDYGSKDLKKILIDSGLVDKKGNILCR